jgi:hypothetical protein
VPQRTLRTSPPSPGRSERRPPRRT